MVRGSIKFKDLSLPTILRIFSHTRKEGVLRITCGTESGKIAFWDEIIMDASFRDFSGEDALAELLTMPEGAFTLEPGTIEGGGETMPTSLDIIDAMRLVDERNALREFVPESSSRVRFVADGSSLDPQLARVVAAMDATGSTVAELSDRIGLSRIRIEILLATLLKQGAAVMDDPQETPALQNGQKPFKILFSFADEAVASAFLDRTAKLFGSSAPNGLKSAFADFIKLSVTGRSVHLFTLRGDKRFSFLWEPMIADSEAAIFLVGRLRDGEHADYFASKLEPENVRCRLIAPPGLTYPGAETIDSDDDILNLFNELLSE